LVGRRSGRVVCFQGWNGGFGLVGRF